MKRNLTRLAFCMSDTCINVMDVDAEGNWTIQSLNYIEHVKGNVITR
jgi:hypothetical protein